MSHANGKHLGGVRNIEDIRLRCACDKEEDGCWHFRSANGKPMTRGKRQTVWLYVKQSAISVPKAVWQLKTGKSVPKGWRAYRVCDSYDCANPKHIKAGPYAWYGIAAANRGVFKCNAANARKAGLKNAKLTPEMRIWAIESPHSGPKTAKMLGVSSSTIARVRIEHRKRIQLGAPSVFHLGASCL